MKHKVSELEGALLDAAVAKAEQDGWEWAPPYSSMWERGGPIIERERIGVENGSCSGTSPSCTDPNIWFSWLPDPNPRYVARGPTPLIAAMRAYVASKFGAALDLP